MGARLLIFDRNRNVRALLQRELLREGYEVVLVKNLAELKEQLKSGSAYDLFIMDLDCFDITFPMTLSWITDNRIPVVIHSYLPENWMEEYLARNIDKELQSRIVVVEKENLEELKDTVKKMISLPAKQLGRDNEIVRETN
ncbi:MAG: hypothetical protein N2260_06350 [Syntrophobacterales bacterium]|nr:hypothetical protein [Syntrophobacterales bacterium]